MPDIKGIGGVFIDSQNATRLAGWYEEVLGIPLEAHPDGIGYYCVFATRDIDSGIVRENPVFAINHARGELATTGRGFTLNFRVDDLHAFLDRLRDQGAPVEDRVLEWERGRHGWTRDPDGNRIELYEEILQDSSDGA